MFEKYHVTDPGVFYNGDDLWSSSKESKTNRRQKDENEASHT